MVAFLLAGTTSNNAAHLFQRQTLRHRNRQTYRRTQRHTHIHMQDTSMAGHRGVTDKALPSPVLGLRRSLVQAHTDHSPSSQTRAHLLLPWESARLFCLAGTFGTWSSSPLMDLLSAGWSSLAICTHAALTQAPHNHWCPRYQCKPSTHQIFCSPTLSAGPA